ncbi:hypothetical protein F4810DRAFT_203862 [Camillea tinctor]|nr:hypothetical protein F4810DRAFT_203862 [Camillea tinctor]
MQTRFYTTAAALAALFSMANAHMIMATPKPYSADELDNSPLTGTNYPCKVKGDPATFYARKDVTTMAIGQTQTLSFKGSAVHGGGSCQLAISKDLQPSASTSWQVIMSIEGGCPSKSGSGPDTYDFTIPDGVEPGDYSFAWTWQSKLAGQPEYYMNCAAITVTGGSAKRSAGNETMELYARADALPELWVGNLAGINEGCKATEDAVYPNPGTNVVRPGTNSKFTPTVGTNCVPQGATENVGSGSGSDSGSDSGSAPSSAASSSAAAASPTSFVTSTTSAAPAATSAAPATSASSAPAGGSSSTPSTGGGLSGACTEEGTFNCVGGTNYQQCASGAWTALMPMPATTKCQEGKSMTLWGRSMNPADAAALDKSKKSFISLRRRGVAA